MQQRIRTHITEIGYLKVLLDKQLRLCYLTDNSNRRHHYNNKQESF